MTNTHHYDHFESQSFVIGTLLIRNMLLYPSTNTLITHKEYSLHFQILASTLYSLLGVPNHQEAEAKRAHKQFSLHSNQRSAGSNQLAVNLELVSQLSVALFVVTKALRFVLKKV